jgi:acyl-CoA synthetase (AMP-forming)/AMP-acid ligase II
MLSHGAVCSHALMTIAELGLGEDDVWGHFAPMFHLADAWATFAITQVGGTHVMLRRFQPAAALDLMVRAGVTVTNLVPTMLNLMVHEPGAAERGFPRLRRVLSGGAPIAPEVVRRVIATFGCDYVQTYGMTETSPFLTMSLPKAKMKAWAEEDRLAVQCSTGRPVLGIDLRVVDQRGQAIARDGRAVGEIQVRGDTVTLGYWQRPDATAAAFTADGYLRTGDLATIDAEGYVRIVDRIKDVINTGGEKVYSTEVEHVLYEHPAVLEAAVFGIADALWGEVVAAAVVLRPGAHATAEDLAGFCRARLGAFKVPKRFSFLAALPRTGSGKIRKRLLRER